MASKHETVADIVREMRNDKTAGHFSIRVFLADRIEAAHKREIAALRADADRRAIIAGASLAEEVQV